jgi:hypothetical protein
LQDKYLADTQVAQQYQQLLEATFVGMSPMFLAGPHMRQIGLLLCSPKQSNAHLVQQQQVAKVDEEPATG